jgi:guanylate kinase|tara:strand:- start:1454 stop:2038 length:585 start_codon:yes stop_codon:yes gene_type:complete
MNPLKNFRGKAIIISAPSGAGKTTLVKRLLETGLPIEFSISACSRKPRENEINGKDYYFLTIDEFKTQIQNSSFIEWEEVYENNFYGTLKKEIDDIWKMEKHVIFDVDVKGGISLKKYFGKNAISIFINPPSLKTLIERLVKRNTENVASISSRIEKSKKEMKYINEFDCVVENDDLSDATKNIIRVVEEFIIM